MISSPTGGKSPVVSKPAVLDASALLCLLNSEDGADQVEKALPKAVIGAVNLAEVVSKLRERGLTADEVDEVLKHLNLEVRPFTLAQAVAAGHLRPSTRDLGLSLGDRACLALAAELGAVALTADRQWSSVPDVAVQVVR